jgi:hypothetical protein
MFSAERPGEQDWAVLRGHRPPLVDRLIAFFRNLVALGLHLYVRLPQIDPKGGSDASE